MEVEPTQGPEEIIPFDSQNIPDHYKPLLVPERPKLSLLDAIAPDHERDLDEVMELQKRLEEEKAAEPPEPILYPYYNCLNCNVKFVPDAELAKRIGTHCSPNCSLRTNKNSYDLGEISAKVFFSVREMILDYFDLDHIVPFPVFSKFRGSIEEYHRATPLPPNFAINYYDRRIDEAKQDDEMEVEHLGEF